MLRRLTALALVLTLALGLASPAAAQLSAPTSQYTQPGPGGVVAWSTASLSVNNLTTAYCVFCYTVPAGFMATSTANNQVPPRMTTLPLKYTMVGTISTQASAIGTGTAIPLSIGINWGGSTATFSMINNSVMQQGMSAVPYTLEVWATPIATTGSANSVFLRGRFTHGQNGTGSSPAGANASEAVWNGSVIGTTDFRTQQQFAVNVQWGSQSTTNAFVIYERVLSIGN